MQGCKSGLHGCVEGAVNRLKEPGEAPLLLLAILRHAALNGQEPPARRATRSQLMRIKGVLFGNRNALEACDDHERTTSGVQNNRKQLYL